MNLMDDPNPSGKAPTITSAAWRGLSAAERARRERDATRLREKCLRSPLYARRADDMEFWATFFDSGVNIYSRVTCRAIW